MRAQARERTLVQEAGEIIGCVRQELPAPETDEKIEIFALEALDIGALRRLCERDMRQSERARIAAQCAETLKQPDIGRACEQHREQRVFLRPRSVDLVNVAGRAGMFSVEVGPQNRSAHAGRSFNRHYAFGRNARPVRHRRLGDANFSRKRADPAGNADRLIKSYVPHRRFSFLF
jgi:hypothetical protein